MSTPSEKMWLLPKKFNPIRNNNNPPPPKKKFLNHPPKISQPPPLENFSTPPPKISQSPPKISEPTLKISQPHSKKYQPQKYVKRYPPPNIPFSFYLFSFTFKKKSENFGGGGGGLNPRNPPLNTPLTIIIFSRYNVFFWLVINTSIVNKLKIMIVLI